jgi:hypothetical protein
LTLAPAVLIVSALAARPVGAEPAQAKQSAGTVRHNEAAATLKQDMRKLWTDHVVWTRDYIIAAVGDQPDATAAANRLMRNQEDIGKAIAAYYGAPAGQQLTTLARQTRIGPKRHSST